VDREQDCGVLQCIGGRGDDGDGGIGCIAEPVCDACMRRVGVVSRD